MAFTLDNGPDNVVNIKVVGVGGAGNNVVNHMISGGTKGVEFVAVNTDKQVLSVSAADQKIQIGVNLTHGQGAGADPDVGRKSAEENRNTIVKAFENTDMVFITAGMGGGTGTGAAPIVADIAKEQGILTVAVVTTPFSFEGKRRRTQADQGLSDLLGKVDSLLVIPNDRLKFTTDTKITMKNAFAVADSVLIQAVSSIYGVITETGLINSDFADITSVMKDSGYAHMGVGGATGKNKAEEAAQKAISSPLMETSIVGAHRVLVYVTGSLDMGLDEIETVGQMVEKAAAPDANIIFGSSLDADLDDEIRVTVIATGFDRVPRAQTTAAPGPLGGGTSRGTNPGLYSGGVQVSGGTTAPAQPRTPPPPPEPLDREVDPFDQILEIFNPK
ncbi:MAG: cell division protein FtsZ [Oscillospiraceae bacterium]|jgi:cell division protein FtsZ|nr:cell division protein FtsZ [Oscillospiraceae bacterium]